MSMIMTGKIRYKVNVIQIGKNNKPTGKFEEKSSEKNVSCP